MPQPSGVNVRRFPIASGHADALWLVLSFGLIALAVWSSFH
jgi:hypothetical protein